MATLALPDDTSTIVWRLVKAQLQADTVLANSGVRILFFDATCEPTKSLTDYQTPAVIFYATLGRMAWFDETSQSGALIVNIAAVIPGLDDEDVLNLQGAIESALYPSTFAFGQALCDAGAVTGQPLFQPLAASPGTAGTDGVLKPMGSFTLEIIRSLTH